MPSPTQSILDRLGLTPDEVLACPPDNSAFAIAPGEVVVLTGPSGAGKTTMLRRVMGTGSAFLSLTKGAERNCTSHLIDAASVPHCDLLAADWLDALGVEDPANWLSRVGLFDAQLLRTPLRHFIEGERLRLAIAAVLPIVNSGDLVVIDEFASSLDFFSGAAVAGMLGRLCRERAIALLIATHREEFLPYIRGGEKEKGKRSDSAFLSEMRMDDSPSHFVSKGARPIPRNYSRPSSSLWNTGLRHYHITHTRVTTREPPAPDSLIDDLHITSGKRSDWPLFARYHYRGKKLGPTAGIWLASIRGEPVGIIVYGFPGHSCRMRRKALGARYLDFVRGDMSSRLLALNEKLRVVQRLVVLPALRGNGIGARLLSETLLLVGVPLIEARAMQPELFLRAGFTSYGRALPDEKVERLVEWARGNFSSDGGTGNPAGAAQTRVSVPPQALLPSSQVKQSVVEGLGNAVMFLSTLADSAARQRFLDSLDPVRSKRLLTLIRSALRPYIESRCGHMRGQVTRDSISDAAWQRLPEMLRRSQYRPEYLVRDRKEEWMG